MTPQQMYYSLSLRLLEEDKKRLDELRKRFKSIDIFRAGLSICEKKAKGEK